MIASFEYTLDPEKYLSQTIELLRSYTDSTISDKFIELAFELSDHYILHKEMNLKKTIFDALVKACENSRYFSISKVLFDSYREMETKTEFEDSIGMYPYIPFGENRFINMVKVLAKQNFKDEKDISFIDVGCGYGVKSAIFASLFPNSSSTGIEYNRTTYKKGSDTFWCTYKNLYLIPGDAFKYDFSKHNFIYLYCPMADSKSMLKLYEHIYETMPINGIFVEVYKTKGFMDFLNSHKIIKTYYSNYSTFYSHIKKTHDGIKFQMFENKILDRLY
jgi:hypothetical protein